MDNAGGPTHAPGEAVLASGRSVARLTVDGRFAAVTTFWLTAPPTITTSLV